MRRFLRPLLLLLPLLAAAGCPGVDPDDDTVRDDDDDDAAGPCADLSRTAAEVDDVRLMDTLSYLTSFPRRDDFAVQDTILDALAVELEEAGAAVRFHDYEHAATDHRNLVATVPAHASLDPEEPHLVVGAHVDSRSELGAELAPGADDNASGVAAVLETARILAACELPTRVDFVFFTNEEIGTVGSEAYAADAAAADERIVAMMAVDMIAFGPDGEDLDLATKTDMAWLAEAVHDGADAYTGTDTVVRIDDHCG